MIDQIKSLMEEEAQLVARCKLLNEAVVALQNLCDHKHGVEIGHDSHYEYYECSECLKKYSI